MKIQKLKEIISKLISKEIKEYEFIPNIAPYKISNMLKAIGYEMSDFESTRNWDHDFWIPFNKKQIHLMFSGNWWGGRQKLNLDLEYMKN